MISTIDTSVPVSTAVEFRLDWIAIVAGTLLAMAMSVVLLAFGSALGLTLISAESTDSAPLPWFTVISGVWFVLVTVSSVAIGGYFSARLRERLPHPDASEVELRDGAHGLVVWAAMVVFSTVVAAGGLAGLAGAVAKASGEVAGAAVDLVDQPLGAVAQDLVRNPTGATGPSDRLVEEATRLLTRTVTEDGEISAADRTYLVGRIATATNESPETVDARLTETIATARTAWNEMQQKLEAVRRAGIIAAFAVAATLLAAGAAGYFAAVAGGGHRDDRIPLRTLLRVT